MSAQAKARLLVMLGVVCTTLPVRADAPPPSAAALAGAAAPAPVAPASPAAAPEAQLPAEHEPSLQVAVDPAGSVHTGDVVHLTIRAEAPVGDDVTVVDQSFAPFEVQKKRARVEPPNGGKQRFVFDLDLLALEPGNDVKIPAVELRVVTKDGFVGSKKTSALPYAVKSLLANEPNAQPKLETKPVVVMQDNYVPLYILAGLLAAALIAGATLLIQRWLRKRKAKATPPPPPRPPWDVAIEKLAELRRRKATMIERGEGARFVEEVSAVLREYLGGRFGFDGLETTTDEMLALLKHNNASLGFTQEVGQFLGRCDLVKFAKVTPDADEVDLLFAKAQDLVQHSQPAPPQLQGPSGPAAPGAPTVPRTETGAAP